MSDLSETAEAIQRHYHDHANKVAGASEFVKLTLVLGGAAAAALAHCVELSHMNEEWSAWTALGFAGVAMVFLGGIFMARTESDAASALNLAREGLEGIRQREQELLSYDEETTELQREVERGLHLYSAMDSMRGAIEQSLSISDGKPTQYLTALLKTARNSLEIAFDFATRDSWTICIFQANALENSDIKALTLAAHVRKIDCEVSTARTWREGVGVAGICYSSKNEIVVPELWTPEMQTVFNNDNGRSYDRDRYRSMVAVPIVLDPETSPWGVVVVTTDKSGHFTLEEKSGIPTAEPARAIAAMAALAVKGMDGASKNTLPVPDKVYPISESTGLTNGTTKPENLEGNKPDITAS